MLVVEAAGHDIVIVETVGVGQSETAVAGMTDMFVLMQLPNAGDDLQAIKKGVMELADLVVINKADLDADAATRARAQIGSALRLFGQHGRPEHAHHDTTLWQPQVLQLSALKVAGAGRLLGPGVALSRAADGQWPAGAAAPAAEQAPGCGSASTPACAPPSASTRVCAQALPQVLQQVDAGQLLPSVAARRLLREMGLAQPAEAPERGAAA